MSGTFELFTDSLYSAKTPLLEARRMAQRRFDQGLGRRRLGQNAKIARQRARVHADADRGALIERRPRTISRTWVSLPMVPGLMRTAAAPHSSAA